MFGGRKVLYGLSSGAPVVLDGVMVTFVDPLGRETRTDKVEYVRWDETPSVGSLARAMRWFDDVRELTKGGAR